jgi:hypothetical protein
MQSCEPRQQAAHIYRMSPQIRYHFLFTVSGISQVSAKISADKLIEQHTDTD